MKHFIVEITYSVPVEQLSEILPQHRAFLKIGYERGMLLVSGPQIPRLGGFVVARAKSVEVLQDFFARDPYNLNHLATYRFVEFDPVLHQPFLSDWLA